MKKKFKSIFESLSSGEYALIAVALLSGAGIFVTNIFASRSEEIKPINFKNAVYSTAQPTQIPQSNPTEQTSNPITGPTSEINNELVNILPKSLVKMNGNTAVYYVDSLKTLHLFPDQKTFNSWFTSKSTIKSISPTIFSSLTQGIFVRSRPGIYILKFKNDTKLYVAEKGGVLHQITTPKIAALLFGAKWQKNVYELSSSMMNSYTFGESVTTKNMKNYRPQLLKTKAVTIEQELGIK